MHMVKAHKVQEFSDKLPEGTMLFNGEYTIKKFLNDGGFGLTYLASDGLNRNVVIKECFPKTICRRSQLIVGIRSKTHMLEFSNMVDFFIKEAVKLSKLKHPNIVHVHHVFEENSTAYMAMDYVTGSDMLTLLENPNYKFEPDDIIEITLKILDAMSYIHATDMLHRDISPDNILIDNRGEPKIIDFGASKEDVSKASRALSAQLQIVKEGYSPQEFYIEGSKQTPASDLYGIAASLYHCITGEVPSNSNLRLSAVAQGAPDLYKPVAGRFKGYPANFLEAVDKNMELFPQSRSQSASEWLAMLGGDPKSNVVPIVPKRKKTMNISVSKFKPVFATVGLFVLLSGAATYYQVFHNNPDNSIQTIISVKKPDGLDVVVKKQVPVVKVETPVAKQIPVAAKPAKNTTSRPTRSIAEIMSELALEAPLDGGADITTLPVK
ncbi:MAG: serine/threonine protein kinase [Proteobacteria bacterium]|nr:serine/threonine protein kinase [Pseudomonadota bacterium]